MWFQYGWLGMFKMIVPGGNHLKKCLTGGQSLEEVSSPTFARSFLKTN